MYIKWIVAILALITISNCQTASHVASGQSPLEFEENNIEKMVRLGIEGGYPLYRGQLQPLRPDVLVRQRPFPSSKFRIIHSYEKNGYQSFESLNSQDGHVQAEQSGDDLNLQFVSNSIYVDSRREKTDLVYHLVLNDHGIPIDLRKIGKDFDRFRWELAALSPVDYYRGHEILPLPDKGFSQDGQYGLGVKDDETEEIHASYQLLGVTVINDRPSLVFDFQLEDSRGYRVLDVATGALVLSHTALKTKNSHSIRLFQLDTSHWGASSIPADHEI